MVNENQNADITEKISHYCNVRHPRCVLYNSKELGMLTITVEHNYMCYYIIGVYNNDMSRPYMSAIIRLWLDFQFRLY